MSPEKNDPPRKIYEKWKKKKAHGQSKKALRQTTGFKNERRGPHQTTIKWEDRGSYHRERKVAHPEKERAKTRDTRRIIYLQAGRAKAPPLPMDQKKGVSREPT